MLYTMTRKKLIALSHSKKQEGNKTSNIVYHIQIYMYIKILIIYFYFIL